MLSAFEGGEDYADGGQSRFRDVLITKQEEPLIQLYINQAIQVTFEKIGKLVAAVTVNDSKTVWTMRDDTLWPAAKNGSILDKHIEETVVSWTMKCWLEYKHNDRAKFYEDMFQNYISLAERNINTSEAPRKTRTYYGN